MSQQDLGLDSRIAEHQRERNFNVDRTPLGVIRQGLSYASALGLTDWADGLFLDPSAGDGRFALVMRESSSDVPKPRHIECIEPRIEELGPLGVVSDIAETARLQDACLSRLHYDVIATNPPFDQWAEIALKCYQDYLAPGGMMVFYGLSTWGHSDEPSEAGELFRRIPPTVQMRIHGRVRHRVGHNPNTGKPYGTDSRKYSWWVWHKAHAGIRGWNTFNLPPLPREERTAEPGMNAAGMKQALTSAQS